MTTTPAGLSRLLTHLRRVVAEEGTRAFARRTGINRSFVSQVVTGKQVPSDTICRAVGWTKATVYKPLDRNGAGR